MQLAPRYGTDPIITLDGAPGEVLAAVVGQRRRLVEVLAGFDREQWAAPSRCAGWSNRDVIVHLDSTNTFWSFSIAAGLAGEPTRFMLSFDPVASPAELVAGSAEVPADQVLERFAASTAALADLLESLDAEGWTTPAEAPPGHLTVDAVVHHALWDSWVHERDVLIPLGVDPVEDAAEVAACLRYAAALSPAFALSRGTGRGVLAVEATAPDLSLLVDIGDRAAVHSRGPGEASGDVASDLTLTGDAVGLIEALSVRRPFDRPLPAETAWMVSGLPEVFEAAPS